MKSRVNWSLLLAGAFSNTQINIGGSIGISELLFFVMAPFVFIADMEQLRKDGFLPLVMAAFLVVVGCCVSGWLNSTPFPLFMKGFATTYSVFACIVVFHRLLRRDLDGLKWVVMGFAISQIINIFIFHQGAEGAMATRQAYDNSTIGVAKTIADSTLFWVNRLTHWLMLPIRGWYLTTPTWYSVSIPLLLSLYAVGFTGSGRSAALGTLGGCILIMIAGKSIRRMKSISKHFVIFVALAVVLAFVAKATYMQLGRMGMLNEAQTKKFNEQTKGGRNTGMMQLLVSGRVEFFSGLYAAIKKPVVGYGPWPVDQDGIYYDFLEKYGDIEDWTMYEATKRELMSSSIRKNWLPSHSFIVEFWQWYGIAGLIFWIYILRQLYVYMKRDIYVVPQWFGYLAVGAPPLLWSIFFSPFGSRMLFAFYFVVLLFNRAIAEGRVRLPNKMICDMSRYAQ